jgi:sulfatase maturation enzyme AslB (radical SAM superfamily)
MDTKVGILMYISLNFNFKVTSALPLCNLVCVFCLYSNTHKAGATKVNIIIIIQTNLAIS